MKYEEFLESKAQRNTDNGFEPIWIPDFLYDFQKSLTEGATRKGRSAIFADCGLGKPRRGPVGLKVRFQQCD